MNKIFLPLTVVFFIVACGPRDVLVESKGKTDRKKTFELSSVGDRSDTCPATRPDNSYIYIPAEDKDLVFSGEITAVLEPGNQNCYKIGTFIDLKISGASGPTNAKVKVVKTLALSVDDITQSQADAFKMTVQELQARGFDEIQKAKTRPKGSFDAGGIVSLTFFKLDGAPDVATQPVFLSEILKFEKEGDRSTTCPSTYQDSIKISLPASKDTDILSGKLIASMTVGDRNCFRILSTVHLQDKGKNAPVRAKLRVVWVEIVPLPILNQDHADALNMTLEALKAEAKKQVDEATGFDPHNTVAITFFDVVK